MKNTIRTFQFFPLSWRMRRVITFSLTLGLIGLLSGCADEEEPIESNPYGDGKGKTVIYVYITSNPLPRNPFPLTLIIDGVNAGTITSGFTENPPNNQLCTMQSSPSAVVFISAAGTHSYSLVSSAGNADGLFTTYEGECNTEGISL